MPPAPQPGPGESSPMGELRTAAPPLAEMSTTVDIHAPTDLPTNPRPHPSAGALLAAGRRLRAPFAVILDGDLPPRLLSGDLLVCDPSAPPAAGDAVIARVPLAEMSPIGDILTAPDAPEMSNALDIRAASDPRPDVTDACGVFLLNGDGDALSPAAVVPRGGFSVVAVVSRVVRRRRSDLGDLGDLGERGAEGRAEA